MRHGPSFCIAAQLTALLLALMVMLVHILVLLLVLQLLLMLMPHVVVMTLSCIWVLSWHDESGVVSLRYILSQI